MAVLEELPLRVGGVGPLPRLFCDRNLPAGRRLVRVDLPGAVLKKLKSARLGLETLAIGETTPERPSRAEQLQLIFSLPYQEDWKDEG